MCRGVTSGQNRRVILAGFADRDFLARFYHERGDVDLLAIHQDMTVAHGLTRLSAAGCEAHPVKNTVEPALEAAQQVFAGDALHACGFFERVAELAFQHAVNAANLLLFAELKTVADELGL